MVLQSPPRRNKKSSATHPPPSSFHVLPLLESSSPSPNNHPRSRFEVRSLQVCDIEKVKELHCATLPVTYPSSFFYSLLGSDPSEKISLVATLPSTSVQGYFDLLSTHHPSSMPLAGSPAHHHGHLAPHHVTSPLSGRKPISLDVVGSISARLASPPAPSVRILTLCVSPAYRRFGVGRLLLDALLKQIRARFARLAALATPQAPPKIPVNLHVQASNRVAHAFYTSAGFVAVCFKQAYYSDNPLKPLDPALKHPSRKPSILHPPPPVPQNTSLETPHPSAPDDSDSETDDIDAWFLELSIDSS
ncbi:hypothetical protein PtA15_12A394 [Puccinia triticina]|uniref:N-acetyltransferase domain-containing protein n=1 Tax=Puccinia triticina TaxID=208348 RepID=A0ABY7D0I2_9BASI|nr:uncharacterized protein PtA15_12A394 [Puccinia triticina]WAQ90405.1 hypothetical protein PtA15_12A394 [Puccinia triticina]WAR61721.1 hypothetical protein PtB15_12B411 [Puccinia triticina]